MGLDFRLRQSPVVDHGHGQVTVQNVTRLTVGAKGGQPQWGRAQRDRSRKVPFLLLHSGTPRLLLVTVPGCDKHLLLGTVPGCDNMVPLKFIPRCWGAGKIEVDFKRTIKRIIRVEVAAIAEVKGDTAPETATLLKVVVLV